MPSLAPICMIGFFLAARAISMSDFTSAIVVPQGLEIRLCGQRLCPRFPGAHRARAAKIAPSQNSRAIHGLRQEKTSEQRVANSEQRRNRERADATSLFAALNSLFASSR